MELTAIESAIESILFALGDSVDIKKLAEVLEVTEGEINDALDELTVKYENPACGVQLVKL